MQCGREGIYIGPETKFFLLAFLRTYLKYKAAAMRGMIRPSKSRETSATIARRMCQPR